LAQVRLKAQLQLHPKESRMKYIVAFLLASGAAGVSLRTSYAMRESMVLAAQSHALDRKIQAYADNLVPGTTRDLLSALRLCAPCKKFERLGEANDGGYVHCADGLEKGLVGAYSYGIKGYDGYGMALAAKYKIPLHEYDCTNSTHPKVCDGCKVTFHSECILDNDAKPRKDFKTLSQQLKDSGNAEAKERSLMLKIDVEAAEWKIFAEEPVENMKKFREIVVEYHWITQLPMGTMVDSLDHRLYLKALKKIEQAGFAVAHIHGNNFAGPLQSLGKYRIPNVIEVTYIQKPKAGCAAHIPYHVPMDMPNNATVPEDGDAVLPKSF